MTAKETMAICLTESSDRCNQKSPVFKHDVAKYIISGDRYCNRLVAN